MSRSVRTDQNIFGHNLENLCGVGLPFYAPAIMGNGKICIDQCMKMLMAKSDKAKHVF